MGDLIVTLSKVEVAEHQLNAAIRLFLDENDFVSAITLAGASEEILGKLLERQERKHSLAELAESCVKVGKHHFGEEWAPKHFVEMQTYFRNGLKHITDGSPITVPRAAADQIIGRAIDNLWALEGRETREIRRYMQAHGW
ncbi:MAG TPA: hypothetical protein VLC55_04650 [Burkholderiales bacterium]|nr:hypothetical protein [Burkholderiales bacterium]